MRTIAIAAALMGLIPLSVVGGCSTPMQLRQPPGQSSIVNGVYINETYGVTLRFANSEGWLFFTKRSGLMARLRQARGSPMDIFAALNPGRVLELQLILEDGGIEMSDEDYQAIMIVRGYSPENREAMEVVSLERDVHGSEGLIWIYKLTGHVWTYAYFQRGTQNFVLGLGTVEGAYERRRGEIDAIINSFVLN